MKTSQYKQEFNTLIDLFGFEAIYHHFGSIYDYIQDRKMFSYEALKECLTITYS